MMAVFVARQSIFAAIPDKSKEHFLVITKKKLRYQLL